MEPIKVDTNGPDSGTNNGRGNSNDEGNAILHVLVIGFHHKKGSQVEYVYPPFQSSTRQDNVTIDEQNGLKDDELPKEWKSLTSLSLPDGAHNFSSDSVLFHLPSLEFRDSEHYPDDEDEDNSPIVYGISSYRQILASDSLKESDSSVTRTTVIKAVVVLSRLPFYGLITAKVDSITRVYFSQKNFNNKSCLIELYQNLNQVLSKTQRSILSPTEATLLSLSPSLYLLTPFTHRLVTLFKLILLEKKILFFSSPATQSSGHSPSIQSAIVQSAESLSNDQGSASNPFSVLSLCLTILTLSSLISKIFSKTSTKQFHLYCTHCQEESNSKSHDEQPSTLNVKCLDDDSSEPVVVEIEHQCEDTFLPPFHLFDHKTYHLHPYVCLSCIDEVSSYKSCLIGATNGLYKQKKSMFDVTVDVTTGKMDFENQELKKLTAPTTEDLRFADFICKHVLPGSKSPKHSTLIDSSEHWEGSDDWMRIQFNLYLLHALKTSLLNELDDGKDVTHSKQIVPFNIKFIKSWRETNNYTNWKRRFFQSKPPEVDDVTFIQKGFGYIKSGHPFAKHSQSHVSKAVADMKLRLMASSYVSAGSSFFIGGSKSTSQDSSIVTPSQRQAVFDVGRDALSSAKASFASWYSPSPINDTSQESNAQESGLQLDFSSVSLSSLLKKQGSPEMPRVVQDGEEDVVYNRSEGKSPVPKPK